MDTGDAGLDKAGHIIQRESAGRHQNDGGDGRNADECQRRDRDVAQQQHDNGDDRSEAKQREDSFTHDWYFLSFFRVFAGPKAFRKVCFFHSRF